MKRIEKYVTVTKTFCKEKSHKNLETKELHKKVKSNMK